MQMPYPGSAPGSGYFQISTLPLDDGRRSLALHQIILLPSYERMLDTGAKLMTANDKETASTAALGSPMGMLAPALNYWVDAAQRTVLFWDVMRQRGNQYREHLAQTAPHVLDYDIELIVDGRRLDRPVNYALVRIVPPAGIEIDPLRRPFVIVDPRAGHGPGIGGFKADSE